MTNFIEFVLLNIPLFILAISAIVLAMWVDKKNAHIKRLENRLSNTSVKLCDVEEEKNKLQDALDTLVQDFNKKVEDSVNKRLEDIFENALALSKIINKSYIELKKIAEPVKKPVAKKKVSKKSDPKRTVGKLK